MGTIAEKLQAVIDSKTAIKTAINNKGGSVTDSTPLSEYSTAIDNLPSGGGVDIPNTAIIKFNGSKNMTTEQMQPILNALDTSDYENMEYMFGDCRKITSLDLSNFNLSNVTNMTNMFSNTTILETVIFPTNPDYNTSKLDYMTSMFRYSNIRTVNLSSLDTSRITNMSQVFTYAARTGTPSILNLSNLQTQNVTDMTNMFSNAGYSEINVTGWDTSNVINFSQMFHFSPNLIKLDLSSFNTGKAQNMSAMFTYNYVLQTIKLGPQFSTPSIITSSSYLPYFAYDYSLKEIVIYNTDSIIRLRNGTGSYASFYSCHHFFGTYHYQYNPQSLKDGKIYVPDALVDTYKAADGWSTVADCIVPLSTYVEE